MFEMHRGHHPDPQHKNKAENQNKSDKRAKRLAMKDKLLIVLLFVVSAWRNCRHTEAYSCKLKFHRDEALLWVIEHCEILVMLNTFFLLFLL